MKTKTIKTRSLAILSAVAVAASMLPATGVMAAAKKPTLNKKSVTLTEGETCKLRVKKNGVKVKKITWSSSDKKVATVNQKGKVSAKSEGTAKVKAVVKTKGKNAKKYTLTCKVTVNASPVNEDPVIPIDGGWQEVESPVVTDVVDTAFKKAQEGKDGVTFTPVALVEQQVVAGMNYKALCKKWTSAAGSKEKYAMCTVYADLEGNATITTVENSEAEVHSTGENISGGWYEPETPEVTADAKTALEKAVNGLVGAEYKPVALLEKQVVAGTNYCMLCKVTPVTIQPTSSYKIVEVYADLEGNAKITQVYDFENSNNY